jgi:hypothetical protein
VRFWQKAKEKGKAGEWGLSIVDSGGKVNKFCNFCKTRKLSPSLLSLTEFARFRVFNLILHVIYLLTCKII